MILMNCAAWEAVAGAYWCYSHPSLRVCPCHIVPTGRGRGCHPVPDGSFVPVWISARGIDEPSSYWAPTHGHSGHFRFEMVKKIKFGHCGYWCHNQLPSCWFIWMFSGATCRCQGRLCWEWQLPQESCSSTRCQTVRWEMWHQEKHIQRQFIDIFRHMADACVQNQHVKLLTGHMIVEHSIYISIWDPNCVVLVESSLSYYND